MLDVTELWKTSTVARPPGETRVPWDAGRIADEEAERSAARRRDGTAYRIQSPRVWVLRQPSHGPIRTYVTNCLDMNGIGVDRSAAEEFDTRQAAKDARAHRIAMGWAMDIDTWRVVRRGPVAQ